jgi:gamma-glutamyl:cysteine ligase YbdK (ATP-grasp superfamily)
MLPPRASTGYCRSICPVDEKGNLRPLTDLIAELVEFCRPTAGNVDEASGLELVADLLAGVPGYEQQLLTYEQNDSTHSVVNMLAEALADSAMPASATTT